MVEELLEEGITRNVQTFKAAQKFGVCLMTENNFKTPLKMWGNSYVIKVPPKIAKLYKLGEEIKVTLGERVEQWEIQKAILVPLTSYVDRSIGKNAKAPTEEMWQVIERFGATFDKAQKRLQKTVEFNKEKNLHYRLVMLSTEELKQG